MSNSDAVETYTSRDERTKNACCKMFFGIVLFVGSFFLLARNEGRSIQRYQSLEEGRKSVVVVADPTSSADSSREGMLVYVTGKAVAAQDATVAYDPTFGVSPSNALKLKRVAEMYQKTPRTNTGRNERDTYTWSESLVDSSGFCSDEPNRNPSSMPYSSQEFSTDPIAVGSYTLSDGLVDKIDWYSDLNNDGSLYSVGNISGGYRRQMAVYGNGFYMGYRPGHPRVGDMKIQFKYIPEGTVSLVAAQAGRTFSPYATQGGGSLLLLRSGYHSVDELFSLDERDNVINTWLLRLVGFVMMFVGLFTGDLMGGATHLITCITAAALSIVTIALALVAYRPDLTFVLSAIVFVLVYIVKRNGYGCW